MCVQVGVFTSCCMTPPVTRDAPCYTDPYHGEGRGLEGACMQSCMSATDKKESQVSHPLPALT